MELPKRKPTRLKNHDYSLPAAYFITICTQGKHCILSTVTSENRISYKKAGVISAKYIDMIQDKFPHIEVHKFVIMPNHIHMILFVYGTEKGLTKDTIIYNENENIKKAMGWFKYMATKEINQAFGRNFTRIFQRSYHDHIIRGKFDYQKIWNYIHTNPLLWRKDCFYPDNTSITNVSGGKTPPLQ